MIEIFLYNLFILLFLHALADFAFQSDAMAKGKSRKNEGKNYERWVSILERDPKKFKKCWFYWLSAHALIQGGLILVIFGIWWIALIEVITHWIIDFIKCEEITNPHHDQLFHFILRVLYAWWLI